MRQTVSVIVALAGLQDTTVMAHRPGTDGAAVSVRVGGALVYMHDAATVATFARTWDEMKPSASLLVRATDPKSVAPIRGMAEPAVMFEAVDSPPVFARLERPVGQPSRLRVTLGRVMFDVRDEAAFRSTAMAFRRAEELAASAFLHAPDLAPREQAARSAARALRATTPRTGRPTVSERSGRTAQPTRVPAARPRRTHGGAFE
ncbi:hypothetical protein ACQPZA_24185 [Pseudonocardia xinjiangensis]|uniref:hypothetical protein n=1 Tax=Pseudonocardia xinjiangensis TaxID=75289 RepID=UPI003D917081